MTLGGSTFMLVNVKNIKRSDVPFPSSRDSDPEVVDGGDLGIKLLTLPGVGLVPRRKRRKMFGEGEHHTPAQVGDVAAAIVADLKPDDV